MNFLGCDGQWVLTGGAIGCTGELHTYTAQEMQNLTVPQLSSQDKALITSQFATFFALIFVLVRLRRLL